MIGTDGKEHEASPRLMISDRIRAGCICGWRSSITHTNRTFYGLLACMADARDHLLEMQAVPDDYDTEAES